MVTFEFSMIIFLVPVIKLFTCDIMNGIILGIRVTQLP